MREFILISSGLNPFLHRPDGGDASNYPRLSARGRIQGDGENRCV
jgi:hypothetical protein